MRASAPEDGVDGPKPGIATDQSGWLVPMMWPTLTLLFVLLPATTSMVIADLSAQSFPDAARSVAGWLQGEGANESVVGGGFGFLAVVATIVIGMAFSLPPDGVQALPKKNRDLIEVLTLSITLVVALFSAAVLWVILWQEVRFDALLLLLSGWLVTLVAGLVELKRPAGERETTARRQSEELRAAAQEVGLSEDAKIPRRQVRRAETVYWLIPAVGVPLLSGAGLLWDFRGQQIDPRAIALIPVLLCGALLAAVAWRATAPFPPHTLSERVLSWIGRSVGAMLMLLPPTGALLAKSWGFASLSLVAVCGAALLYVVPKAQNRFRFMKTIRDASTLKRLERADSWYRAVRRELDELDCELLASGGADVRREPLIRIEVFRRRSSRGFPKRDHGS